MPVSKTNLQSCVCMTNLASVSVALGTNVIPKKCNKIQQGLRQNTTYHIYSSPHIHQNTTPPFANRGCAWKYLGAYQFQKHSENTKFQTPRFEENDNRKSRYCYLEFEAIRQFLIENSKHLLINQQKIIVILLS